MNDVTVIASIVRLLTAVGGGAGIWTWASNRQGNAFGAASDAVSMVRDQLNYARTENTELRSKVDRLHDDLEDVKNELRAVREELAHTRAVADEAGRWQARYDDAAQRASALRPAPLNSRRSCARTTSSPWPPATPPAPSAAASTDRSRSRSRPRSRCAPTPDPHAPPAAASEAPHEPPDATVGPGAPAVLRPSRAHEPAGA